MKKSRAYPSAVRCSSSVARMWSVLRDVPVWISSRAFDFGLAVRSSASVGKMRPHSGVIRTVFIFSFTFFSFLAPQNILWTLTTLVAVHVISWQSVPASHGWRQKRFTCWEFFVYFSLALRPSLRMDLLWTVVFNSKAVNMPWVSTVICWRKKPPA